MFVSLTRPLAKQAVDRKRTGLNCPEVAVTLQDVRKSFGAGYVVASLDCAAGSEGKLHWCSAFMFSFEP